LDAQYNEIRPKDSNLISFFSGGIFMLVIFLIFTFVSETDYSK